MFATVAKPPAPKGSTWWNSRRPPSPHLRPESETNAQRPRSRVHTARRTFAGMCLLPAAVARACRAGFYDGLVDATRSLVARASAAGASQLECSLFVERLGVAVAAVVSSQERTAAEVRDVLRLFVFLRQAALR